MSEQVAILNNSTFGAKEETTENTAAPPTTTNGVLLRQDAIAWNLSRDLLEDNYMTGSLSRTSPVAGMWPDDMGATLPVYLRGGAEASTPTERPDFNILMKSIFGSELTGYADTDIDTTATTTSATLTSGTNVSVGQLIRIGLTGGSEISRVMTKSTNDITFWPPVSTTPQDADVVELGTNYLLLDSSWPTFTGDFFFDGSKKLRYTGCRCSSLSMSFEVGQRVPADFAMQALTPAYSYATPTAFVNDLSTKPPVCLGIALSTTYSGTITGTPTTTETVLLTPDFEVAIGDYIIVDVGSGVYEVKAISNVSGNAGSNITITHAALSGAGTATETAYIKRDRCAGIGDTLNITLEMTRETIKCMQASAGKYQSVFTDRNITIEKTPYFKSWQEFMMRDSVVGSELMIILGSMTNNITAIYMPNVINADVSIGAETLMKNPVSSRAVVDSILGNKYEMVMAFF